MFNNAAQLMHYAGGLSGVEAGFYVSLMAVATIPGVVKAYMREKTERHRVDHEFRMSQQDMERLRLVADLGRENSQLRTNLADISRAHNSLLRCLDEEDQLYVDGEYILSGRDVRRGPLRRRSASVPETLDGYYFVRSIVAPQSGGRFRVHIRNAESGIELTAVVRPEDSSDDLMSAVYYGFRDRRPIPMRIEASSSGGQIINAVLVSTDWSQL